MSRRYEQPWVPVGLSVALTLVALAGTGCSAQVAELADPAEIPPQPAVAAGYPTVNVPPAFRDTTPLTAEQRQRITEELTALRDRQEQEITGSIPARAPASR
jgi:hypothetical protein